MWAFKNKLTDTVVEQSKLIESLRSEISNVTQKAASASGQVGALRETIRILTEQCREHLERAKNAEKALLDQLVPKNPQVGNVDLAGLFGETEEETEKAREKLEKTGMVVEEGLL